MTETATETTLARMHLNDRLYQNDPDLVRLDITASTLADFTAQELVDFVQLLLTNTTVTHVHLSGQHLDDHIVVSGQIDLLLSNIGKLQNLQELFVFCGNCPSLTTSKLAHCVAHAHKLCVLMTWGFCFDGEPDLAAALRHHPSLERVTLTLPRTRQHAWACMDVYAMAVCAMPRLKCLSVQCENAHQKEAVFSSEAVALILTSPVLQSLYLEKCGLVDDHSDAIAEELVNNKSLTLLDLKHNLFSDDALFAFGQALKSNATLQSLDLSGVTITEQGVNALADALHTNCTINNLELEGVLSRYLDEFNVPEGHSNKDYMQALNFQLRLNRAGKAESRPLYVEALNLVSDHLGCLYHLVRKHPQYCDRSLQTETLVTNGLPVLKAMQETQEIVERLSEPVRRMFEAYEMH
jgi:hypothetical protein